MQTVVCFKAHNCHLRPAFGYSGFYNLINLKNNKDPQKTAVYPYNIAIDCLLYANWCQYTGGSCNSYGDYFPLELFS